MIRKIKNILILSSLLGVFSLSSCNFDLNNSVTNVEKDPEPIVPPDPSGPSGEGGKTDGGEYYPITDSGVVVDSDVYSGEGEPGEEQISAHKLSASVVDDNVDFEYWKEILNREQGVQQYPSYDDEEADVISEESPKTSGKGFKDLYETYNFKTLNRIKVGLPRNLYAKVTLKDENEKVVYKARSLRSGEAYLFSPEVLENYTISVEYLNAARELVTNTKSFQEFKDVSFTDLEYTENNLNKMQILFLIDATGSMGDEMMYLKSEMTSVIERVVAKNEGAEIETSALVYRDHGDEYVTRANDFSGNIADTINFLSQQYANGGGDYEEAVDEALDEALQQSWRDDSSTKLIIHVADAPCHNDEINNWAAQAMEATEKGIRIITLGCSGAYRTFEYCGRSQSIMTGGQYAYLTNHSGYGGYHDTPDTQDEKVVEYLDDCLVRLITGHHQGEFEEPVPFDVQPEENQENQ